MATITGTVDGDALTGTTLQDLIMGLEGNDLLVGDAGDDTVKGGDGQDSIFGGDGNDSLFGGFGDDAIHGDAGNDLIEGSSGNDSLFGDAGDDNISGGSGDDSLEGGDGNDTVAGNSGNDLILGGAGSDTIVGGSGFDTLDYSAATVAVNANLNTHVVETTLGRSLADGIEKFIGSAFDDTISGDGLANELWGGSGNDVIRSRAGADTLSGGFGQDTFVYMQKDVMLGGVHQGVDFIKDFRSSDKIDVRDFFKGVSVSDYNEVMQLTYDGANTTLSVNTTGTFVDVLSFAGKFSVPAALLVEDQVILV